MSIWSEDRVLDLQKRWRGGESASAIAKIYSKEVGRSISRNAVIGKIHRSMAYGDRIRVAASTPNALKTRPASMSLPASKPPKPAKAVTPAQQGQTAAIVIHSEASVGRNALARFEAIRPGLSVSLLALEEGMCKRPSGGAGADTLYCGNRTERKRGGYDSFCVQCKITLIDGRRSAKRPAYESQPLHRKKTFAPAPRWGQING